MQALQRQHFLVYGLLLVCQSARALIYREEGAELGLVAERQCSASGLAGAGRLQHGVHHVDVRGGVLFAFHWTSLAWLGGAWLCCGGLGFATCLSILLLRTLLGLPGLGLFQVFLSAWLSVWKLGHIVQRLQLLTIFVLRRLDFVFRGMVHGLLEHERKVTVVLVVRADLLLQSEREALQ